MRSYRDLDRVRSDCKKIEVTRIEECHIYTLINGRNIVICRFNLNLIFLPFSALRI